MSDRTKIFISSSGQPELKRLRDTTFDHLVTLGHNPQMYERNFGPWAAFDTIVQHCLKKVRESDLFFLYISDRPGTYLADEDASVTHLELLEAYKERKEIIIFVDDSVHTLFFDQIKGQIDDAVALYFEANRQEPPSVFSLIKTIENLPSHIPPYTWVILYDVAQKGMYCEIMSLGVDIQQKLTEYLSHLLKKGASLLPTLHEIEENEISALEYAEFQDLAFEMVGLIRDGIVTDWRRFLNTLREKLRGGTVVQRAGQYRSDKLGDYRDCQGITLFRRDGDQMVLVESDGRTGRRAFFMLDDEESFVVQAHRRPNEETMFYVPEKQMLYMTSAIDQFVLTMHFPLGPTWNAYKVKRFQTELLHAILKQQRNKQFFTFTKRILEGCR